MVDLGKSVDAILESTADLLIRVCSEPSKPIVNPPIDTTELNKRVATYQAELNSLELQLLEMIDIAEKQANVVAKSPLDAAHSNPGIPDISAPQGDNFDGLFESEYLDF